MQFPIDYDECALAELLCRDGPRPNMLEGLNNTDQYFGCELANADKDTLLEFLRSL